MVAARAMPLGFQMLRMPGTNASTMPKVEQRRPSHRRAPNIRTGDNWLTNERAQANRVGEGRERAGEPADFHGAPGGALGVVRLDGDEVVVDQMDAARGGHDLHERRQHDQERRHFAAAPVDQRHRGRLAVDRDAEHHERPGSQRSHHQQTRNTATAEGIAKWSSESLLAWSTVRPSITGPAKC